MMNDECILYKVTVLISEFPTLKCQEHNELSLWKFTAGEVLYSRKLLRENAFLNLVVW